MPAPFCVLPHSGNAGVMLHRYTQHNIRLLMRTGVTRDGHKIRSSSHAREY